MHYVSYQLIAICFPTSSTIELRVQALQARKELKAESNQDRAARRERSASYVSSVCSRAPSDFLAAEESRILAGNTNFSAEQTRNLSSTAFDTTFLRVPTIDQTSSTTTSYRHRYARSAEPDIQPSTRASKDNYSRFARSPSLAIPGQTFYGNAKQGVTDGKHRRAASLPGIEEEDNYHMYRAHHTVLLDANGGGGSISSRAGSLYPSLDSLKAELRPKKLLPVKGRSVAAAVSKFEKIEEEQTLDLLRSRVPKRKATEHSVANAEAGAGAETQSLDGRGAAKRVRV